MNELKLPEQLEGPWHHALILTYGVEIPFFENALWRQFRTSCRNKIILADGRCYLEACANYARSGLVRHLNQRYVAEGIFAPRAAHAKLILLTNPEQGRLLVGSGNLRWQGYASGGELFTQYEYSTDEPQAINAFLAVRELIEGLATHGYIGAQAERRIRHLLEETPWLFQSPVGEWQPVRHNLNLSFLSHLQQAVGDKPVEELWILSPFYDKEAVALERLLATLEPRQATLLVQADYTSVDASALERVLNRFPDCCRVHSFAMGRDSPYVHAKLYLLKLTDRAICLQGSPNLSQVAMLLTVPQGNIELANLLAGPRDTFDELLEALDIQPDAAPLNTLGLSYHPAETPADLASDGWRLTGGEWWGDRLYLGFQGTLPDLEGAWLVIADRTFPLEVHKREAQSLELQLSSEAAGLLGRPVPVAIRWGEEEDTMTSNPIFVCNRAALDAVLQVADEGETLGRVGDLDLDDEEFERLLGELDAALMIDRRSVWQLARRTPPKTTDEDDEALRLDYADVDYEMLRQHPKLRQYVSRGAGGQRYARSRLQIILNAITDHFRGLLDISDSPRLVEGAIAKLEESDAETEEERELEEEEKQRQRQTRAQRIRRILKNFIRRYLRGIRSPDFQELAAFEVMAQNYVIFVHILWRLFAKDWVEPEFVVDSLLRTWGFFWGDSTQLGYFNELPLEEREQVLQWVHDYHADAELVAALYHSAHLTHIERWHELRFALRDLWREMLRRPPFEVTAETLEEAWRILAHLIPYQPPLPSVIVEELSDLSELETDHSFFRELEVQFRYPTGSCRFEKMKVRRLSFADSVVVSCLVVSADDALPNLEAALALLRKWMRFWNLDYYRIHAPAGGRRLYYDVREQQGLYWATDQSGTFLNFGPITPSTTDWDAAMSRIRTLAAQAEEGAKHFLSDAKTVSLRCRGTNGVHRVVGSGSDDAQSDW